MGGYNKRIHPGRRTCSLIASRRPHDEEDVHEQVDDVQVELNSGYDVLLGGQAMHNHVGVKNYKT